MSPKVGAQDRPNNQSRHILRDLGFPDLFLEVTADRDPWVIYRIRSPP